MVDFRKRMKEDKVNENTNLVKYGEYTGEAAAAESEEARKRGGARVPFTKFPEGATSVRVLPPLQGKTSPFLKVVQHRLDCDAIIDVLEMDDARANALRDAFANRKFPVILPCPREHGGVYCKACDNAFELYEAGQADKRRKADKEVGYERMPKTRVFANVLVRGEESKGPQVWGMSQKIWGELSDMRKNPKIGNFTDPGDKGFDIVVTRQGTGPMDTRYTISAERVGGPLSDDAAQALAWIEAQHDLSFMTEASSLEDVVARILKEDDERGTQPARGARKPAGPTAQDDIEDGEVA